MKTIEITCDDCQRDLASTGNSVDYRLALTNEPISSRGGFVTDVGAYSAIERNAHFCGLVCLSRWLVKTYPLLMERAAELAAPASGA